MQPKQLDDVEVKVLESSDRLPENVLQWDEQRIWGGDNRVRREGREGLGIECLFVFRWFHEQTDPTAQNVAEIVQVLNNISPSAAKDFVQAYLGDLTQTLPKASKASHQELPPSDWVNVSVLSQIFNKTTNSYKYLFFISLLDIIKRRQFDNSVPISFEEIIIEMLVNAWYPHNYFKLFFGTQDQIANKLDFLNLVINEPILKFQDPDKKLLRKSIKSQNFDDISNFISRYVPFRLIRPFFAQETKGLLDAKVNQALIELAQNRFEEIKPIYRFDAAYLKDCKAIILHQKWMEYIAKNYSIIRGWVSWEWLQYMQQRNPTIPNVVNKIFMPQQRDSLTEQTKYWRIILENHNIECIYPKKILDKERISLDHYLPWSFVAHDQLWNLIPTFPETNSAKSNNLPADDYFEDFIRLQHFGLTVSHQSLSESKWYKFIDGYINELKLNNTQDLLDLQKLRSAYEATIKPLVSLATIQGFMPGWFYRSA